MDTPGLYTGGCMCGEIRYEASGPLMFTVLCHCHMCQQWSGSAFFGSSAFQRENVTFVHGAPRDYRSSSVCDRGFCGTCGSSLYTRYASGGIFDNVLFIGVGTLDNPEWTRPVAHYGAEGEISWMRLADGLPRLRIDVDDPAKQNALLDELKSAAMNHMPGM